MDSPFPSKIKLRKFNGVLEIPNFQQEDTGSYECIAENSRGRNVARGRLTYYGELLFWANWIFRLCSLNKMLGGGNLWQNANVQLVLFPFLK